MGKLPISAFIIAKNEADRIPLAIESVRDWVEEVIVVDSGSTDDTVTVAKALGARVEFNEWRGYGPQKAFGESLCRNDWLLNLDADEEITPALRDEIAALFVMGTPPMPLYRVKVTTVYPHHRRPRFLAESKNIIRLYDRNVARFPDHPTWDAINPPPGAAIGQLRVPCLHHTWRDIAHYMDKINTYSSMQAEHQPLKPYWFLIIQLVFGPPLDFVKAYLLRRHFTGGSFGFIVSGMFVISRFLKNAKMVERHLKMRAARRDRRDSTQEQACPGQDSKS